MDSQGRLALRYSGILADRAEMDPTDAHNVIEGGKRFLAAHAYFYVDGVVPERLFSHTQEFQIRFRGTQSGSLIYDLVINVGGSAIYDVLRFSFEAFLVHSFLTWREGRKLEEPGHFRMQPMLEGRYVNHPTFDVSPERDRECEKLAERITQAMGQMTMPIGRSAARLDLSLNGKNLGTWDRRLRSWTEEDIAVAVRSLRRQGPSLRTL